MRLGIGCLVVAAAGLAYQAVGSAVDAHRFPAPGRLVDVAGHRLHLDCRGQRSSRPTVVLDAGLGDSSQVWDTVATQVSSFVRVCTFDRPGYGWSPMWRGVRADAASRAVALHDLLRAAGEPPPYVMGGHSLGGAYAYHYARSFPADVAGLVLVDPGDDATGAGFDRWRRDTLTRAQNQRFDSLSADDPGTGSGLAIVRAGRVLAPFGVPRLLLALPGDDDPLLPAAQQHVEDSLRSRCRFFSALLLETRSTAEVYRDAYTTTATIDGPVVVLQAGLFRTRADEQTEPAPPFVVEILQRWRSQRLQRLAASSLRGRAIVVPTSGHYVQLDDPAAVVGAIRSVVSDASDTPASRSSR